MYLRNQAEIAVAAKAAKELGYQVTQADIREHRYMVNFPKNGRGRNGGPRAGAGRTWQRIHLSLEHARRLRALLKAQPGSAYGEAAVREWVEMRIDAEWSEYEAEITTASEWNGEVV